LRAGHIAGGCTHKLEQPYRCYAVENQSQELTRHRFPLRLVIEPARWWYWSTCEVRLPISMLQSPNAYDASFLKYQVPKSVCAEDDFGHSRSPRRWFRSIDKIYDLQVLWAFTHMLLWDGLCCALWCHAFSRTWIFICIKMADDDDDEVLMLSATYCELMHINLYWSLIGSSLLVLACC